jgi:murein DD-endopeptidase MepM/ murein hydrolase activator NlpD
VLAGCSADVKRFDWPTLGLNETSGSVSSIPMPREDVRHTSSTSLSMQTLSPTYGANAPSPPALTEYGGVAARADFQPAAGSPAAPAQITPRPVTQRLVLAAGGKGAASAAAKKALHQAEVRPGTVLRIPSGGAGSSGPVATVKTADEATAAAAHSASPAAVVPEIINAKPKQFAALQPIETVTNAASAHDDPATAAGPADADGAIAATQAVPASKFRWPVKGKVIGGFGPKPDGTHNDGINVAVPLGTDVLAAESGVVAYAGSELKGYGQLILIRHDNGWSTAYAHNDQLQVAHGDRVRRGQVIAKAGKSGGVDQPQVRFEIRHRSTPVDPLAHLE